LGNRLFCVWVAPGVADCHKQDGPDPFLDQDRAGAGMVCGLALNRSFFAQRLWAAGGIGRLIYAWGG
jgi:hypothetical protein